MGPNLTAAEGMILGNAAKMFSCCGARCAPCRRCGCVTHRPLPLAQVASSATGGAPIAPHRRTRNSLRYSGECDLWDYLLDNYHNVKTGGQWPPVHLLFSFYFGTFKFYNKMLSTSFCWFDFNIKRVAFIVQFFNGIAHPPRLINTVYINIRCFDFIVV